MTVPLDPGLLAAVLASPADDAPRLVLADWLEEHGDDARSAFIRVQLELAKCPPLPLFPAFVSPPRAYQKNRRDDFVPPDSFLEGDVPTAALPAEFREPPPAVDLGGIGDLTIRRTFLFRVEATDPTTGYVFRCPKVRLVSARPRNAVLSSVKLQLLPLHPEEEKAETLRRRSRELLGRTKRALTLRQVEDPEYAWLGESVRYIFETGPRDGLHERFWEWRRGFVEGVTLPADYWLAHADAILACQPVTSVRLTTLPEMCLRRSGGGSGWQLYGSLRGREWPIPTLATESERLTVALASEWPGITFTLPEV